MKVMAELGLDGTAEMGNCIFKRLLGGRQRIGIQRWLDQALPHACGYSSVVPSMMNEP